MGVMATFCHICGGPMNFDCYSAEEKEGPSGNFPFSAEHDWLKEALAVSVDEDDGDLFEGKVEENMLITAAGEELYVGDGIDCGDYFTVHKACADIAGGYRASNPRSEGWLLIEPFQDQLFDFLACRNQHADWMLSDPRTEAGKKNRKRIEDMLKSLAPSDDSTGAGSAYDLIKNHASWKKRETNQMKSCFRDNLGAFKRDDYSTLVLIKKPYFVDEIGNPKAYMMDLIDGFQRDLQAKIEAIWAPETGKHPPLAIFAGYICQGGMSTHYIYTRNPGEVESILKRCGDLDSPMTSETILKEDPAWKEVADFG